MLQSSFQTAASVNHLSYGYCNTPFHWLMEINRMEVYGIKLDPQTCIMLRVEQKMADNAQGRAKDGGQIEGRANSNLHDPGSS